MKQLICFLLLFIIYSCSNKEQKVGSIPENLDAKAYFYKTISEGIERGDTIFTLNSLFEIEFDTLFIFPGYTPIGDIQPHLDGYTIEEYSGRQEIEGNQDLLLVKKGGVRYYFKIDSVYTITDSRKFSYTPNSKISINLFKMSDNTDGAYIIPIDD